VKRIRLAPALAFLLAVGALVWWLVNFEQVPETIYSGLSGKARSDPYLAFKRLLAASGMRYDEVAPTTAPDDAFATLPRGGSLILLPRREVLMSTTRIDTLMQWVSSGGHLIVGAEPVVRRDPLLNFLGFAPEWMRAPTPSQGGRPSAQALSVTARHVELRLPGSKRALAIEMSTPIVLKDLRNQAEWRAGDAGGTRLLLMRRGAGRITVAADLGWITYRGTAGNADPARQPNHIGKADNAEVIIALLRLDGRAPTAGVRILGGRSELSLWRWLEANAWTALASLGLLIALWLWRVVPRFGPLAPAEDVAELRLASHLEASGRFYRRHLPIEEIHQGLRRAFLARLAERRPGIAARGPAERNAELARLAGVNPQAVARALDAPAQSVGDFVRGSITLKRLEQAL
jgi:hypothetical protein